MLRRLLLRSCVIIVNLRFFWGVFSHVKNGLSQICVVIICLSVFACFVLTNDTDL